MASAAGNDVMKSPPERSVRGFFCGRAFGKKAHVQKKGVTVFLPSREEAVPECSVSGRRRKEEGRSCAMDAFVGCAFPQGMPQGRF